MQEFWQPQLYFAWKVIFFYFHAKFRSLGTFFFLGCNVNFISPSHAFKVREKAQDLI